MRYENRSLLSPGFDGLPWQEKLAVCTQVNEREILHDTLPSGDANSSGVGSEEGPCELRSSFSYGCRGPQGGERWVASLVSIPQCWIWKRVSQPFFSHLEETQREGYDCPRSPSIVGPGTEQKAKTGEPGQGLFCHSSLYWGFIETSLVSTGHLWRWPLTPQLPTSDQTLLGSPQALWATLGV